MKKVVSIVFLCVGCLIAQDSPIRINMIGLDFNLLNLRDGIYSGHYGRIIRNGAGEINIPFSLMRVRNKKEDITLTRFRSNLQYRKYKNNQGRGLFRGGYLESLVINLKIDTITVWAIGFGPGVEMGYRWIWGNRFTIAPAIGTGYAFAYAFQKATEKTPAADLSKHFITMKLTLGFSYLWGAKN
ncbi:DUF3575 domain-containing protein [Caldithrix abyssi]|nr:DUF3575 domain-containing protein [Caldithrix abyssi]